MFGRRRERGQQEPPVDASVDAVDGPGSEDHGGVDASRASGTERTSGPWDEGEVDDLQGFIDLGSVRVKGVPGLSMQVQVDEQTQAVRVVTLALQDAAVQVQAFAAPRSGGLWNEVRPQIMSSITAGGGMVEEASGRFGTELRARVPGQGGALQPARFVGVDGPRWFLRGLFLGAAAAPTGHAGLDDVFADIVVVRGSEARASGEALPLTMPSGAGTEPTSS